MLLIGVNVQPQFREHLRCPGMSTSKLVRNNTGWSRAPTWILRKPGGPLPDFLAAVPLQNSSETSVPVSDPWHFSLYLFRVYDMKF